MQTSLLGNKAVLMTIFSLSLLAILQDGYHLAVAAASIQRFHCRAVVPYLWLYLANLALGCVTNVHIYSLLSVAACLLTK